MPEDIFNSHTVTVTEDQYYKFCTAIGEIITEEKLIELATSDNNIRFSPPIFAASCSKNGLQCLNRLASYKKLIAPITWEITENNTEISLTILSNEKDTLPLFFIESELLFLISLIRKCTMEDISPKIIFMHEAPSTSLFSNYAKCDIHSGNANKVVFNKADLEKPFISSNNTMFKYLEPELNKRLADLNIDESISNKVRSALSELLSAGEPTIEAVAEKLNMSKRSLQRKLQDENTGFQKQLNSVRESLALNYIKSTNLSVEEISFLLSYNEVNSFLRAFKIWTGKTVQQYKLDNNI
nr:helix-turn-helix transcriptional regulator [Lachnoanaerobaculum saburreum]